MVSKPKVVSQIQNPNSCVIKITHILFILFFIGRRTKTFPVKNDYSQKIHVQANPKHLHELTVNGITRGRRQNSLLCCPGHSSPQLVPPPLPAPPLTQQQCICLPTDMCCMPMPASPQQIQPALSPPRLCICTPMCCVPITPPQLPPQMAPSIQACDCLQVTVRVQPGVICRPCPPPLPPQQEQMAPPLIPPPPVCICTPIQQDPCCMSSSPPSIPQMTGVRSICMCTPVQQDPCCTLLASPPIPPPLSKKAICICAPVQQDACCLPSPPISPQAQMEPIRTTCICTPVRQDICCLPMQHQEPLLPPPSPPVCICTQIHQDPCCLPLPQMAPVPSPLTIQSITIQCAPICVPPPLPPQTPQMRQQPSIVMQCQPMKCQQVNCKPICQCQPGYVQCAQKCCLRYRKNFSPLQQDNNNKISKYGSKVSNSNPAEINGVNEQLIMPQPSSNPSLLSTPLSKRTVELFQKH